MTDDAFTPTIIATSDREARALHLTALIPHLEWSKLIEQIDPRTQVIVALVRHEHGHDMALSRVTYYRLERQAHFNSIENVYIRTQSATSVAFFVMPKR